MGEESGRRGVYWMGMACNIIHTHTHLNMLCRTTWPLKDRVVTPLLLQILTSYTPPTTAQTKVKTRWVTNRAINTRYCTTLTQRHLVNQDT